MDSEKNIGKLTEDQKHFVKRICAEMIAYQIIKDRMKEKEKTKSEN